MVSKHENITEENFVTERLKKFALMVVIILIGIIIQTQQAKAGDFHRESQKKNKQLYYKQNQVLAKACKRLKHKRAQTQNFAVKGDKHVLKYR
ncbi:MAG: hypothetical protein O9340_04165 [Cyclobacteriaceae bacterium]|jgi:hypothetical protein|nr:hypothetical protein [Cyclobacteriaceae bacterium]